MNQNRFVVLSWVQELHELEDSPHITQQIQAATPEPSGCLHTACVWGKTYVGETLMQTSTRIQLHQKSIVEKKWMGEESLLMEKLAELDLTGKKRTS